MKSEVKRDQAQPTSPAVLTPRANSREWSDFLQGAPLGLISNSAVAGRATVHTRSLAASPRGIGTGRRCTVFFPLPLREVRHH